MRRTAAVVVTLLMVLVALPVAAADLIVNPDDAEAGSVVSVAGTGYTPGLSCDLHFNTGAIPTDDSSQVGGCTVDSGGGISGSFPVPFVAAGSYTVWACNANGGGTPCDNPNVERANASLQVAPPATTTTAATTTTTTTATTTTTTATTSTTTATTSTTAASTTTSSTSSSTTSVPSPTTTPRRVLPIGPTTTTTAPVVPARLPSKTSTPAISVPATTVAQVHSPPPAGPSVVETELVALGLPAASGVVVVLTGRRLLRWLKWRRRPYGWIRRPTPG